MADHCCASKAGELERLAHVAEQRRVLIIVLAINAVMFVAAAAVAMFSSPWPVF